MTQTETLQPLEIDGVVAYPETAVRDYLEKSYWVDQTHSEMFFESVSKHPDNTAVILGDDQLSYRELGDKILRIATGFLQQGLNRGDRVVVHLPNIPEFIQVVFALFEIGAIPIFALPAHRRTEIEYFIRFSDARGYITVASHDSVDLGSLATELQRDIECLEFTWVVGSQNQSFDELLRFDPIEHRRRSLPSDLAFLQLSGGTTGRPKLIPRTHADYLYSVRESARICALDQDSVQLVVLPISHNFTMSSPGILGALYAGSTIVLAANGSPDTAFSLIERHRVTHSSLVPPLVLMWLNSSSSAHHDLSSLQVLQVGGAKLSEEAARRVRPELGVQLQQVFGMAEGLVNYTRLDDEEEIIIGTQGLRISPDDEVRVVDDQDQDVDLGEEGHLLTRGPYTIRGYFRSPEHNARSFTGDGFYRTGDIVRMNEKGYLTVLGRSKDQINRGGEKIAPEEVENLLLGHEAVHDASVVGVEDRLLGERTKAFVILREEVDSDSISAVEIKRYLRDLGVASFKIPDMVSFVSQFPQTGIGKISKRDQR